MAHTGGKGSQMAVVYYEMKQKAIHSAINHAFVFAHII